MLEQHLYNLLFLHFLPKLPTLSLLVWFWKSTISALLSLSNVCHSALDTGAAENLLLTYTEFIKRPQTSNKKIS